MIYEANKTYKIQDFTGYYYTATIIEDDGLCICFVDKDNLKIKLPKVQIKRAREVKQ